jgi:hypothetical protein
MKPRSIVCLQMILLLFLTCLSFAATPKNVQAFDGATWAAWHATWHAPSALDMRLRPYFVPRLPGRCDRDVYSGDSGHDTFSCSETVNNVDVAYGAPRETGELLPACAACLSVRSERLGQIPNDLELGGAATPVVPAR